MWEISQAPEISMNAEGAGSNVRQVVSGGGAMFLKVVSHLPLMGTVPSVRAFSAPSAVGATGPGCVADDSEHAVMATAPSSTRATRSITTVLNIESLLLWHSFGHQQSG
jgi:hypothetical protein